MYKPSLRTSVISFSLWKNIGNSTPKSSKNLNIAVFDALLLPTGLLKTSSCMAAYHSISVGKAMIIQTQLWRNCCSS